LPKLGRGYLNRVNKFHQFLMYRNFTTEMSRDRNGSDQIGQTDMAQTE